MDILYTEYRCVECDQAFKRDEALEHKRDNGHEIIKKLIHPMKHVSSPRVEIVLEKKDAKDVAVEYCIDCKRKVFAPALHKRQGHSVYTPKGGV